MILQEKQNGQPREELKLQPEKQTFDSNLMSLPPVACSNSHKIKVGGDDKSTSYNVILGCNAMQ
jgi:hypothetical protein